MKTISLTHAGKKNLHVGCGDIYLPGWINVDIRSDIKTDIRDDISRLENVEDQYYDIVYSCHNLEHFGFNLVRPNFYEVVAKWIGKLKTGGLLSLSVPNMKVLGSLLNRVTKPYEQWTFLKAIYGGCEYETNRHYMGFTVEILSETLQGLGLHDIKKFKPFVNDTSKFKLAGRDISLNICANKKFDISEAQMKENIAKLQHRFS